MSKDKISTKFIEALVKYEDCPETIFKLATTDFEKAVAVEFFLVNKKQETISTKLTYLEKIILSVFGIGVVGVLIQVIPKIFGM